MSTETCTFFTEGQMEYCQKLEKSSYKMYIYAYFNINNYPLMSEFYGTAPILSRKNVLAILQNKEKHKFVIV